METEQIVEYDGAQSSFVQVYNFNWYEQLVFKTDLYDFKKWFVIFKIRGSIPLFWHQYPNLKYKSKPTIIPLENHVEACSKHIKEIIDEYGDIVMINLVSV